MRSGTNFRKLLALNGTRRPFSGSRISHNRYIPKKEIPNAPIEDEETEEGGEFVLESATYFYGRVLAFLACSAGSFYLYSSLNKEKNRFGRERFLFPSTTEKMQQFSLHTSYTLFSSLLEEDKLLSPSLKTYQALHILLEELVSGAVSLGADHLATLSWKIHLIDTDTCNIITLPDGNIFIDKGLLLTVGDIKSMATILAHELGHIYGQHIEEMYTIAASRAAFMIPLLVFPLGGSHPAHTFDALLKFPFETKQEEEADQFASQLLESLGYSANECKNFWENIEKQQEEEEKKKKKKKTLSRHSAGLQERILHLGEKEVLKE